MGIGAGKSYIGSEVVREILEKHNLGGLIPINRESRVIAYFINSYPTHEDDLIEPESLDLELILIFNELIFIFGRYFGFGWVLIRNDKIWAAAVDIYLNIEELGDRNDR